METRPFISSICLCLLLLIEPFWNGNCVAMSLSRPSACLLIEPVWNGNMPKQIGPTMVKIASNRTSLEWKLLLFAVCEDSCFLLIEPVWNGNTHRVSVRWSYPHLLIEPVWNGNSFAWRATESSVSLLIEPVWNGNL